MEGVEEENPVPLSADYYYMKALSYLASSTDSNLDGTYHSDEGSCSCLHCHSSEEAEDEHFAMNFRPGLTHDDLRGGSSSGGCSTTTGSSSSSGTRSSSPAGRDPTARRHSVSHTPTCTAPRTRKYSIGSKSYAGAATGSGEAAGAGGQTRVRRKLSDGHVHWADEFQKDLTRCHPRKSYSRHPPVQTPLVKPILKPNAEVCEASFEPSPMN